MHSRIGPPVIQPYYDLLKLLGKKTSNRKACLSPGFFPGSVLVRWLQQPYSYRWVPAELPWEPSGDSMFFIYIVTLVAVSMIMTAAASENPFCLISAHRGK